jgi:hypothetical protein
MENDYVPEIWTVNLKKEERKMAERKDLPKVKVTVAPKNKVILDEHGVVEVDEGLAKKLLGPDHAGEGWELVKEEPETAKGKRASKVGDPTKEEFAQTI